MIDEDIDMVRRLYERFNARDVDGVLGQLDGEVIWANGMEGGHIVGHDALRDYWTRQWAVISPLVEPISFDRTEPGVVEVEVIQTVHDPQGNLIGKPSMRVGHIFRIRNLRVARFDIRGAV